jgi:ribonucleoside-triphosphate reductase
MQKNNVLDSLIVVKRSGQRCEFQGEKIAIAIKKAFDSVEHSYENKDINTVYSFVLAKIHKDYQNRKTIKIEDIQDIILEVLEKEHYTSVFHHYRKYREQRALSRESFTTKEQHKFLKSMEKLGLNDKEDPKLVGSSLHPQEMFYHFGRVISEEFAQSFLLDHKTVRTIDSGVIYLHQLKYYPMGNPSSVQLLYSKFLNGSATYHVFDALLSLSRVIRSIFLEQHGNVMIPYFEKEFEPILIQHFGMIWKETLELKLSSFGLQEILPMNFFYDKVNELSSLEIDIEDYRFFYQQSEPIKTLFLDSYRESLETLQKNLQEAFRWFLSELQFSYDQNFNKQYVSLSFGTENTMASIMIDKVLIQELLNQHPTSVIGIFKLKASLHFGSNALMSDVRKLAQDAYLKGVLDFEFLDVTYNQSEEDVCYGYGGERAFYDNTTQDGVYVGEKGSVSFTSINLPRIALRHQHEEKEAFYQELLEVLELTKNEILERFEYQCSKHNYNFPYLIGKGVWKFGENVKDNDRLRKIFKHGVLQVNFVGLWETIWILLGKRETDAEAQEEVFHLLSFIKKTLDRYSLENNLNFALCALELDEVGRYFLELDEVIYGKIKGLSNPFQYGSSFEVMKKMNLESRIELEGKFHALCNGGHVFVLKETPKKDLETILKWMLSCQIGYTHCDIS